MTDAPTTLWHRLSRGISRAGTVLLILALGATLTACGDDSDMTGGMNGDDLSPPSVANSIGDQELVVNDDEDTDDTETIDVSGVFEGEELTLSASSGDSGVAAVSLDGNTLTVDPDNGGSTTVTVTAENSAGSADANFEVSVVLPPGPGNPDEEGS
jgi:hypothetical protein